ncbi:MAG: hypothetical protein E4H07_07755 [Nitrosomonadales bacterium]|nr:MAG: hypothetical protein E4H07_07755 [Nitrosomonadales bacterium]
MTARPLILVIIVLILIASAYTISCSEKLVAKKVLLRATEKELVDSEILLIECNESLGKIDEKISKLRDLIVKKKEDELSACKGAFDAKISLFKILFKAANNREATDDDIHDMKRSLGITTV